MGDDDLVTEADPRAEMPEVEAAGRFRLYLGAAPGVGKTFDMLAEGHRRAARGADVVVAVAETYGRPNTAAQLAGLEMVPKKQVEYRGARFEEMDLAAVLARRPRVALVDELAHTNVPGSGRNEKRWQDVLDLLAAGIDVISTVNIQHVESLADAVETMTGVRVKERVPDDVVRRADQIELVDSSPEQLRRRMLHGNVYPPERVPRALGGFFKTDNLIALRELALRFLADATEEELLEHLKRHSSPGQWETAERFLVAVTAAPGTDVLMRRAARMAARAKAELLALNVRGDTRATPESRRTMDELRQLAEALGADWYQVFEDDPAEAIVSFAHSNQITQIVIGSSQRSRLQEMAGRGSVIRQILRRSGQLGIDVHVIARRVLSPADQDVDQATTTGER